MAGYRSVDEALSSVGRGGWHIVAKDPQYTETTAKDPDSGQTVKTRTQTSTIWTIQNEDGTQSDTMEVGDTAAPDAKGGLAITVIKGPTKNVTTTTPRATPAAGLERLDASLQPTTDPAKAVYIRDPNAPAGTTPFKLETAGDLGDPSTWTPIRENQADPSSKVIGLFDPKTGKVAATVSGGARESDPSKWTPVYRIPGDPKSGIVGQLDTVNHELHAVSAAPDGKQIVTTPNAIYNVDKDTGTTTKLTDLTPDHPVQVITYPDGSIYTFDQSKPAGQQLVKQQAGHLPQTIVSKDVNGKDTTYVLNPDTNQYELPPGIPGARSIDTTPATLRRTVIRDAQGNVVSDEPNTNYNPTQTTQGSQSTTARMIQQWDPKANNGDGGWVWVENKGRVTASDALRAMASQLSGQVVAGDISQDEAVNLINAANAKMTNDINAQNAADQRAKTSVSAATGILNAQQNAAQTGAGMLNQRVSSATGALSNIMGQVAGSKIMNWPSGAGAQLVQGLTDWTAQLGGGQATYDAAAQMVRNAAPNISGDPNLASQAYSALRGLMDLYKQRTGEDYSSALTQQNLGAGPGANGGIVAPTTPVQTNVSVNQNLAAAQNAANPNPVSTAALNQRGLLDTPQGRAIAAGQTPVAITPPVYPGQYNPAYQQGMVSAVGMPATGPVVGITPIPMITAGQFSAPMTV